MLYFAKVKRTKTKSFASLDTFVIAKVSPGLLCKNPSRLQIDFRWSRKCFLVLSLCPPRLLCHILLQNQNEQHSTLMNAYMRLTTMCRAYTYVIFYFSLTGWKNLMNSTDLVFHTVNEKSKHAVQNFYLKRWVKNIFGAKIQIEN